MKIGIISLVIISALFWFFISSNKVQLIEPSSSDHAALQAQPRTQTNTSDLPNKTEKPPASNDMATYSANGTQTTDEIPKTHLDHLSPEMKQALKDKLFHHGPKTTTVDNQGRIRMDLNGRYVSMPVAVRKADGTIEIKEYSVVPETNTEASP